MHGLVNLTQAVELLNEGGDRVSLQVLWRYTQKYADALQPVKEGRSVVVDFEVLKKHRDENIWRAGRGNGTSDISQGGRAEEAARNLRAQRRLRELDLAERESSLVLTLEAEEAAQAAAECMRDALTNALDQTCSQLAAVTGVDAKLFRPALKAYANRGLAQFCKVLRDKQLMDVNFDVNLT